MMVQQINVARALSLRKRGRTWNYIGHVLAIEDGRTMPYQGLSVWNAVKRETKKPRSEERGFP